MSDVTHLQFKLMSTEAQRTAVQRLALRGSSHTEIAKQTGLTMQEVRSHLQSPGASFSHDAFEFPHWMRRRSEAARAATPAAHMSHVTAS